MAENTEAPFVSKLDAESQERAKKELNEDLKNRDGAVETFRKWVKEQPWLKSPTDTEFLLRFLRTKKFSQLEARKALESYWSAKTTNTTWFANKDPTDKLIQAVLDTGFALRLPRTDKTGRIYMMLRFGAVDPKHFKKNLGGTDGLFRTMTCLMDWVGMDERVQVNGLVMTIDLTGYTSEHRSFIHTPENMKKIANTFQHVYPMRVKSMNLYNLPPLFEAVLTIMKTFMKEKMKSRIIIVGKSLTHLYDKLDMSVLPEEYLPDDYEGECSGSIQSIIDKMKKEISQPEVVDHIKKLTDGRYCIDTKLKPVTDEPAASFRKLNVD